MAGEHARPAAIPSRISSFKMNFATLLVIHAIITFVAGIVLVVAPAWIPSAVGVRLGPGANLLAYLLAAAEFAIAALSYLGRRVSNEETKRLIVSTFVIFHGTSGLFEGIEALAGTVRGAIWGNVLARAIIIGLLLYYGREREPKGTLM